MREGIQVVGPVWTAASFVRLDLPGLFFRFWFRIVHREQRLHVFNHLDRFRFFAPSSKEHLLLLADDRFFLDLVVQLFNQFRLLLDLLGLFFNLFRQDSKNVLRIGCVVLCVVTIFQALTIPHSSKYFSHDPTRFSSGFDGVFLHDAQAVQKPAQLLFAQSDDLIGRPGPLKTAILQPFGDKQETIFFPKQSFDRRRLPPAKQEQAVLIRVQTHGRFDQTAKAVDAFAKVGILGTDIDVVDASEIKGPHKEARTRRSRSGLAWFWIYTFPFCVWMMITDFSEPEGFLERWTSVKEEVWVSVVVFSSFIIKRPPISSLRIPDDQEVGKTRSHLPRRPKIFMFWDLSMI